MRLTPPNSLVLLMLAAGSTAGGAVVTVAAPGPSLNCFPFNCFAGFQGARYQQVYAAEAFPGAVTIGGIEFYNSMNDAPAEVAAATYSIYLSTTAKAVNGLDTTTLDNNPGADNTAVRELVIGAPLLVPDEGTFSIPLDHPFDYDPSNGNLLLDIFVSGYGGEGSGYFDAWNAVPAIQISRAMECTGCGGTSGYGLATGFVTLEVPEPGTLGLALAAMGVFALRRGR